MAKITWGEIGKRFFETGVDHVVLYPQSNGTYPKGVAWNGVTSIAENPSGAEDNPLYADNMKYLNLKGIEELGATLECFTYPDEWAACNGESTLVNGATVTQQSRTPFGLSYRTKVGNDTDGDNHAYKLHLLYGGLSSPSERSYDTINESPEAATYSYEITTTPVPVSGTSKDGKPFRPTSLIVIDSRTVDKAKLTELEKKLYGDTSTEPQLPLPDEIKTLLTPAQKQ